MEYFRQLINTFLQRYFHSSEQDVAPELKRLNIYTNAFYKVLSWEDPVLTWKTLGIVHLILWLILQLQLRLYSVLSILVLTAFLCDIYFERVGLKYKDNETAYFTNILLSVREFLRSLQNLRRTNPKKFCVILSGFFFILLLLSRNIPGLLLLYFALISVFFTPLIISKVPPEYLEPIKRAIHKLSTDEGVVAEADLIPVASEKELDSLITDKSQDSITNSLLGGVMSMPSHLDVEGSLDELEEEDLDLPLRPSRGSAVSYTPGDLSTDSDSEHKGIAFESSHFNGETSSEDEEKKYIAGMKFSEETIDGCENHSSQLPIASTSAGLLDNLVSVGQNIISSALRKRESLPKRQDSDSDYEFINSEDIQ